MSFHKDLRGDDLHPSKIDGYAGSPIGNLVPEYIGQPIIDIVNKTYYLSNGLTDDDWEIIGAAGGGLVLSAATDVDPSGRVDGYILEWNETTQLHEYKYIARDSYSNKTADYTLVSTDHTIGVTCSTSNLTMTLFSAADLPGKVINIKKLDNTPRTVIVTPQAGETIDGDVNKIITSQWTSMTLQSTGTNWIII